MNLTNVLTKWEMITGLENEMAENELVSLVVKQFNVKSKKKRIRNKVYKKVRSQVNIIENLSEEIQQPRYIETPVVEIQEEKIQSEMVEVVSDTVTGLPVTFLLKLGKQYLGDEAIVRGYYKTSEPTYYKNRELLEMTLNNQITTLSPSLQNEFWSLVKEEKDKKKKTKG